MKKLLKKILACAICSAMVISMTACSSSGQANKGTLNIFVWTEYVPDSVIERAKELVKDLSECFNIFIERRYACKSQIGI